jgi:aspartate/methionine/tyrosine aminotransferase
LSYRTLTRAARAIVSADDDMRSEAASLSAVDGLPEASTAQLRDLRGRLRGAHATLKAAGRELNLTRGKPATEQVALSDGLLTAVTARADCLAEDDTDCTNYYGSPQGLIETRRLFAPIIGAPPEQTLIGNNSSLALMHDAVVFALLTGARDGGEPWSRSRTPIAFLCPAPGYDRHFAICEQYGIRMIPVRLTGHGPDMDEVERLVADPQVKGMWCVPKYSNPTGETYAPETVERLARMPAAADDFRVFWDNAYAVHTLTETLDNLVNFIDACSRAGQPDRALVFASTSKITYAQAGLGLFAASPTNMAWYLKRLASRTIGPDKLNQLRHARMFGDAAAIDRAHAAPAPADRAEIPSRTGRVSRPARRHRRRPLDRAARRLFHFARCDGRLRQAGRHAGQRLRRGGGAGGPHLSLRPRSARHQPAHRADIPADRGSAPSRPSTGHMHAAGGDRKTLARPRRERLTTPEMALDGAVGQVDCTVGVRHGAGVRPYARHLGNIAAPITSES